MFTVATAITRLTSGPTNLFGDSALTSGQQLQRINEVLECFYDLGTWRGCQASVNLTSSGGILTLAAAYQRLDGLSVPANVCYVPIKSQQWQFSPSGPGNQNWANYPDLVAIDMGDNTSGLRQYQLTGGTTQLDALAFVGLARKRFTWITDTATVVAPDSYQALAQGILAYRYKDQQDEAKFQSAMQDALNLLNGSLQEFEQPEKQVIVEANFGMGSFALVN